MTDKLAATEKLIYDGRYTEALNQLTGMDSDSAEVSLLIGKCQLELGNYEAAEQSLRKSASLKPANFNAWYLLGNACEGQRKTNDAKDAYRIAYNANPKFEPAKRKIEAYGLLKKKPPKEERLPASDSEVKPGIAHEKKSAAVYYTEYVFSFLWSGLLTGGIIGVITGFFSSAALGQTGVILGIVVGVLIFFAVGFISAGNVTRLKK